MPSGAIFSVEGGMADLRLYTYQSGFGAQQHMSLHTWDTLFVGDACR